MQNPRLIMGLSAVFAGLTVLLLAAAAATRTVFVLFVTIPLGITAAVMWYHGTGRLEARARARAARGERSQRRGGPFAGRTNRGSRRRGQRIGGQRVGSQRVGGRRRQRPGGRGVGETPSMSIREAASVLGVDPDADESAVKAAYRQQVKRHHPDVEGGDEATFKRVTEAYDRLS